MPIQLQASVERMKYCPRVSEVFGLHVDYEIYRCSYSTGQRLYEPGRFSYFNQCAAEFCYVKNPIVEENNEHWNDDCTPFEKTINLEIINNEGKPINIVKSSFGDSVRCKFCRFVVARVVNVYKINFYDAECFMMITDFECEEINRERIADSIISCFNKEDNRQRNIPRMIRQYKADNDIPEEITSKKSSILRKLFRQSF